ncbi:hypothetical protein PV328_012377, partial [Microctonus aethiopoides]
YIDCTSTRDMYSLVRFDNDEHLIIKSKNVKRGQENMCCVKYKGSSYGGYLIKKNHSVKKLQELLKYLILSNLTCDKQSNDYSNIAKESEGFTKQTNSSKLANEN